MVFYVAASDPASTCNNSSSPATTLERIQNGFRGLVTQHVRGQPVLVSKALGWRMRRCGKRSKPRGLLVNDPIDLGPPRALAFESRLLVKIRPFSAGFLKCLEKLVETPLTLTSMEFIAAINSVPSSVSV